KVILLCDSWYAKKNLLRVVDEEENLDIICNARNDSVIYDLAPKKTGKRGRPAKYGKRLSIEDDFSLSDEKNSDDYTGVRHVLSHLFGEREVLAFVTCTEKKGSSRRLFFSTVFPEQISLFCAWQEKAPLNQTGYRWMPYIPLFLYGFRWNMEVSDDEHKTFWSLCRYMVRSKNGIEMLVNLINISYCAMKILPYQDAAFSEYQDKSVQEFRFALSSQIREQVFYAHFVKNIESHIKSNRLINALKLVIQQQGYYF
ncbi:MAG: transposase, partial [Lachnospiraceae bacterium]|nr:transposase [Lachnospiraceae bacterium]